MLDFVPIRVWMLIALAAVVALPLKYVFKHLAHSPGRRDITLPPQDLRWRSSGKLTRNLLIIGASAAVAVFIFTPAASRFASSNMFLPSILGALGIAALYSVASGVLKGKIQPWVRGVYQTYDRSAQPKRYWASVTWNAILGCGLLWFSFTDLDQSRRDQCLKVGTPQTARAKLASCNELLGKASKTKQRGDYLAARAVAYHWLHDYPHAIKDYSEAFRLNPHDVNSLYNRGMIYGWLQNPKLALSDYNEVLALNPDFTPANFSRGLLFLNVGAFDKAVADLSRVIDANPDDLWAVADRGMAYAWMGNRAAAERDFGTISQTDPAHSVVLHGEAILDLREGNEQRAIMRLSEVLRTNPKDIWALRTRANIYWKIGERDKARDDDDRLAPLLAEAARQRGRV